MKQSSCTDLHYTAKANMVTAIFLGKHTDSIPGVVVKIRHRTKHFVFFQLFHGLWQLGIQSATPYIAVDGVQPLLVDLLQRMIFCKSPLCSAFRITDLLTGAVQFVPRRKATSVFGMLYVGGQDPFLPHPAEFFLRAFFRNRHGKLADFIRRLHRRKIPVSQWAGKGFCHFGQHGIW